MVWRTRSRVARCDESDFRAKRARARGCDGTAVLKQRRSDLM